ncbi:Pachytene checkpoint protein 2 [Mortierella sp. NVP85]|nr:Pachytene checkpoint protein 2 [Mortierella sp. NVP85]
MNSSSSLPALKPILQIEARLTPICSIPYHEARERVRHFLFNKTLLSSFYEITENERDEDEFVSTHIERIWVGECFRRHGSGSGLGLGSGLGTRAGSVPSSQTPLRGVPEVVVVQDVELSIYVYQVHDQGAVEEYNETDHGQEVESVMMAHHWTLPCEEFEGIWENLIFDEPIHIKLLEYVRTTILFSDKNVNPNLISWNRVVLLHGPPGTGKTSLCRALAQKLSIRLSERFRYGKLLEINSHSLFSKWYSESGKMVQRMFDQIWNLVEDENAFVCVLIDEVESLAAARKAALSGNEPSDSIRVVNALLTQIDRLKKKKNVLILTTSNMTEAIDIAFIDRADIKLRIGLPSQMAIFNLLNTSFGELLRTGIIHIDNATLLQDTSEQLQKIAGLATGLSARVIRKLPFLAYAGYIQSSATNVEEYLNALEQTVIDERRQEIDM